MEQRKTVETEIALNYDDPSVLGFLHLADIIEKRDGGLAASVSLMMAMSVVALSVSPRHAVEKAITSILNLTEAKMAETSGDLEKAGINPDDPLFWIKPGGVGMRILDILLKVRNGHRISVTMPGDRRSKKSYTQSNGVAVDPAQFRKLRPFLKPLDPPLFEGAEPMCYGWSPSDAE